MKKISTVLAATVTAAYTVVSAPIALADLAVAPNTTELGDQARLVNGDIVQGWTVSGLKPSTDTIPYPVAGTLWEATATDKAIQGPVTPIVSNFNARADNGETYRALFQVATPQGVNPATVAQGQETSGKVYFDVTGAQPDSVVYNAGGQDLAVWRQPAAAPAPQGGSRSTPAYRGGSGYTAQTPAAAPAATGTLPQVAPTSAPAGVATTPAPAAAPMTPVPAGSQGTPLPAGSEGTPLPAGSAGTPLPPSAPAPAPATTVEPAPMPASMQGTAITATTPGTPVAPVATTTPVPVP